MKHKYYTGIVATALFCGTTAATAQQYYYFTTEGEGPYFRAGIGPSFFQDGRLNQFGGPANNSVRYDTGLAADAAFGFAFNQNFSLDFESGFIGARINHVQGYSSDDSSIDNLPLLVNATFSAPIPRTNIIPYAGIGAGGAISTFHTDGFSDGLTTVYGQESEGVFAYQVFAGVRFLLTPQMSLGVGYKYFATDNPVFSYPPSPNFDVGFQGVRTHSILFTLQLNF